MITLGMLAAIFFVGSPGARNDRSHDVGGGPRGLLRAHAGARAVSAALILVLALVAVPVLAPWANENQRPFSCRLLTDEQKKCAFGSCDQRTIERLKRECLRDGGSP